MRTGANKARRHMVALVALLALAPAARAEYAVLRSGQRLHITGYERRGALVRLQLDGGSVEVLAEELAAIEPEEAFPAPASPTLKMPYAEDPRCGAETRRGAGADRKRHRHRIELQPARGLAQTGARPDAVEARYGGAA
jgi:hypothetical protein